MARAARVLAQAKINLTLRILARETSGYHAIETVFARLALGDDVIVRVRDDDVRSVACSVDVGPADRNLAWRAAAAFADHVGWPRGFAIEIEKRIPVGGGLGGGSADAGAVLRALTVLAPRAPAASALLAIAAQLGSDVPFCASEAPLALAWGHGERMLALPPLPARETALVCPGFAVSTPDAYAWLDDSRAAAGAVRDAGASLVTLGELSRWESIASRSVNDFESVVGARHPQVPTTLAALREAGASPARLSGSGAVMFGVFATPGGAADVARRVDGRVVVTASASRVSPIEVLD